MAIPNLAATATSYGVTKVRELTTSWLTVTGNAGGSMTSYDPIPAEYSAKIHTLIITNIDGTMAGGIMSLVSNDHQGQVDIKMSIADNDLFAETNVGTITARTIKVTPPIGLSFTISRILDL